jgi:hypothetical protein
MDNWCICWFFRLIFNKMHGSLRKIMLLTSPGEFIEIPVVFWSCRESTACNLLPGSKELAVEP